MKYYLLNLLHVLLVVLQIMLLIIHPNTEATWQKEILITFHTRCPNQVFATKPVALLKFRHINQTTPVCL